MTAPSTNVFLAVEALRAYAAAKGEGGRLVDTQTLAAAGDGASDSSAYMHDVRRAIAKSSRRAEKILGDYTEETRGIARYHYLMGEINAPGASLLRVVATGYYMRDAHDACCMTIGSVARDLLDCAAPVLGARRVSPDEWLAEQIGMSVADMHLAQVVATAAHLVLAEKWQDSLASPGFFKNFRHFGVADAGAWLAELVQLVRATCDGHSDRTCWHAAMILTRRLVTTRKTPGAQCTLDIFADIENERREDERWVAFIDRAYFYLYVAGEVRAPRARDHFERCRAVLAWLGQSE